jgi:uncharacterized lipoprotein YddW (UPF0748 family)
VRRRTVLAAAAAATLPAACADLGPRPAPPLPAPEPPPVPREFRGAWVACVANIDWPSKPGLPAAALRDEALVILDRAVALKLNAIVLQVRPAGDAIYPSALEPWSEYLSGEQGRPPWAAGEPAWDPLAFWVEQAHRRGLELHAWFNPYRARHSSAKSPLAPLHLGQRQPALVKRYGDMLWMDPGEPAAAQHTLAVVGDVLRRYDIDGVHIDDYFYPYPVPGPGGVDTPFPDDEAWARHQLGGGALGSGTLARDDWRRANVDALVQAMHRTVRETKPWVRFGISPFGIGKPARRPPGVAGFSQYDKLYADVERWLAEGWLDYLVPQLYWPIDRPGQQFPVLLDYWLAENPARRHVWSGLFTSRVRDQRKGEALGPNAWPAREIVEQLAVQRQRASAEPLAAGHVHFSMKALLDDRDGVATLLQMGPYAEPALPPATPWLQAPTVTAPRLLAAGAGAVALDPRQVPAHVAAWAVWRRQAGAWSFAVLGPGERRLETAGADAVAVAAVDRAGRLGPYAHWSR